MQEIGIAGAGRMGSAFAQRLIEQGGKVRIWNRSPRRLDHALAAGAAPAADLADLAQCEVILLSLTNAEASQAVIAGLAEAGLSGRLVIEMSTLLPQESQALAEQVTAAGADYLECPVGGTVGPALKGQLLGMAGGSEAAFARAAPVLAHLCRRVEHMGPVGAGARMKLALNLPLAIYWQTLGEALQLLEGSGIAMDTAISLMADSSAGPNVLKTRGGVVVDTLTGQDQIGTFDINGLAKDLGLALALVGAGKLPLAEAVQARYRAAQAAGLGGYDGASLTKAALMGTS